MKVLLINPNRTYAKETRPNIGLPLGLLYVAASLQSHAIPVSVLDCLTSPETSVEDDGERVRIGVHESAIRARLLREDPEVVGIGCTFTSQWENAAELIELVRATLPDTVIVLGGPHATVSAAQILRAYPAVDYVIAGEGELSFPRLIEALLDRNEEAIRNIPGLAMCEANGEVHANPVQAIADLDALPFPAYHLIDCERFFALQEQGMFARERNVRSVSIITSRGCPYACVFCSVHLSMGRKWRAHSADYVVEHIRYLKQKLGVLHLNIEDDNFTLIAARAKEICSRLVAEQMCVTWDTPNGVRADTLDDELLSVMKASGCVGLDVAAESGDQDVLNKIIKKKLDLRVIERAAAMGQKHGVRMRCFFVIGFPGETRRSIRRTMDFAVKLSARYQCDPMLNIATPLPGTELAALAQRGGYLVRDLTPRNLAEATAGDGRGKGMIRTAEFTPEYVRKCVIRVGRRIRLVHLRSLLLHPKALLAALERRLVKR